MARWFPGFLLSHHIGRGWRAIGGLLVVASLLELAAALGLASIAGFSQVDAVIAHFSWHWLLLLPASPVAAISGWLLARKLARQL